MKSKLEILRFSTTGRTEGLLNPIQLLQLKFITEPDFRKQLLDDPETAFRTVGIEPSEDLLSTLADLKEDLAKLAHQLDVSIYFI